MPIPDSARYARDAAEAIGARFEDLDDGNGYLFRISKDGRFILGGGGNICAYPVNSAAAYTVSRDKAHTKRVLQSGGIPVIDGGLFFAQTRRAAMRSPGREAADAVNFASQLGYPVFCKPNLGSRGTFAEIVRNEAGLADYISRVAVDFEAFLIEPLLGGAEHRVLVQDGRPVFHSTKNEPTLLGDGRSTLAELLGAMNQDIAADGVSALPVSALGADASRVPAAGERVGLPGRRNLSAAGAVEQVSEVVPVALAALAISAVRALGLRIGAVDMFDISSQGDLSRLVVIEVNGNPGLRTLENTNRSDLIRSIWTSMLNECLSS
jgi:glutathione synthase/RimK-type ligase-like ATP-grasp enzyme